MKKIICFFTIFVFWGITDSMAQGLHFGVKAGVLGNKANISGMRDQFKEESLTGFQVGPMLQYQTGFHGIALDFSLLYVERGIKLTNTSNRRSADIKTQSIDIPIELKWEMGISDNFDLFLGVGPSFSFLVDKDNWGRKLAHIAVDVIDKDLLSIWSNTASSFCVNPFTLRKKRRLVEKYIGMESASIEFPPLSPTPLYTFKMYISI